MTAPVHEAKKILNSLPEDTTFEEIIQELAMHKMILKGLDDAKKGKTRSNQKVKELIEKW